MTSMAEECRAPLVVEDPESAFEDVQPQRRSLNSSRVWKAAALVTGSCALATLAVSRTGAPVRTQRQVDGITQLVEDKECIKAFNGPCESDDDCCDGGTCVEENEFWKGCKPAGDDEGSGRGKEADAPEAEVGDKGDVGEPDASTSAAEATGTTGCCYSIGYGDMMAPCCLKTTEGVEESACETGNLMGGATGWVEGACPTSAEEAAGLLNPEGPETTGGPAVLPETTAAPAALPGTAGLPAVLPETTEAPAALPGNGGPPAVLPETTEAPGALPGTADPPAVLPETTGAGPEAPPETSAPEKACMPAWHGSCADDSSCCDGLTCSTVNPHWSQCVVEEEQGGCMKEWQGQCETHADCCEHLICADDNGWKMCSPPKCTESGEDCSQTHCCSETGMTCYKKNEWWSSCNATCSSNSLWDQDAGEWVETDEAHWECEAHGPATPEGGWKDVPEHTKEKIEKDKKKSAVVDSDIALGVAAVVSNATEELGNFTGNTSLDASKELGNLTGNTSLDVSKELGNFTGNMSLDVSKEADESTTAAP